jgi:hypothetical protein
MNIKIYAHRFYLWLLQFIQLQLFITLFSLPILIAWGLPLSILSPVGNLIFSPVLTLFLFLSCIIFFCEIFFIPNGWLIYLLEILTAWWLKILRIPDKRWLIGFHQPSLFILIALPCLAFFILIHKKTSSVYRSIACFSGLLAGLIVYTHYAQPIDCYLPIDCNAGTLHILQKSDTVTVIDPGHLGSRASSTSWAQYTLVPYLIKQTGKTVIDHLVLLRPGTFLFQTVAQLTRCVTIKNIYLIYWEGAMSKNGLHAYYALKKILQEQNVTLIRFGYAPLIIEPAAETPITITPLKTPISKNDISYPACSVQTQIDNNTITFYSAQYKHKENIYLPAQEEKLTS